MTLGIDNLGQRLDEVYSSTIIDVSFLKKLKNFDPTLLMRFDRIMNRWVILEPRLDNSGYSRIMVLQDRDGNHKQPGDWVLNKLFVKRQQNIAARDGGRNYIPHMFESSEKEKNKILSEKSRDNKDKIKDNFICYKKGIAEIMNEPTSDVTAGYQFNPPTKKKDRKNYGKL